MSNVYHQYFKTDELNIIHIRSMFADFKTQYLALFHEGHKKLISQRRVTRPKREEGSNSYPSKK